MESRIRIAADNNRVVPIYNLHWEIQSSWPTSGNRETKTEMQLPTLPFDLVA